MEKNKLKIMMVIAAIMAVALLPAAFAEENAEQTTEVEAQLQLEANTREDTLTDTDAGTTPDSPLYGLDKAMDRIRLAMTFDKARRAEKSLAVAEERLAELRQMVANGDLDAAAKAQAEYELSVQTSVDSTNQIETDDDEQKTRASLEKIARLKNRTEAHRENVISMQEQILLRVSDRLTEEQLQWLKNTFARMNNRTLEANARVVNKNEAAKTKYKILSGKSENEVEIEVNGIESENGYEQSRQERIQKQIDRAEALVERLEEKFNSENITLDEKETLEAHIALLRQLIEEAKISLNEDSEEAMQLGEYARNYGNDISEIARQLGDARQNLTNETFEEMKLRLKAQIQERFDENKEELLERLRERAKQESNEEAIIRIENRIENINDLDWRYEMKIRDGEIREKIRIESNDDRIREEIRNEREEISDNNEDELQDSVCPPVQRPDCTEGYVAQLRVNADGCKVAACVSANVETEINVDDSVNRIVDCPEIAQPECGQGYELEDFKDQNGCKYFECVVNN